jgi:hypothetical protein
MTNDLPTSDESFLRLHAAGWSIGDAAATGPDGMVWLVTGTNGENVIRAEGATRDAAWWAAIGQAASVGMLGARPVPPAMEG